MKTFSSLSDIVLMIKRIFQGINEGSVREKYCEQIVLKYFHYFCRSEALNILMKRTCAS